MDRDWKEKTTPDRRNTKGNNIEVKAGLASSGKTKDTSMVGACEQAGLGERGQSDQGPRSHKSLQDTVSPWGS